MQNTFHALALSVAIGFFSPVASAQGKDQFQVTRKGRFDESSEKLIQRFSRLRYGMTPKQVKKLFPEPAVNRWELHGVDRNSSMEIAFQWQEEVFFTFAFANPRRSINGKYHLPDDDSDEWKLECAGVVKEKTRIEDGQQMVEKAFETPSVLYVYQRPTTEPAGADQPATKPADKPSKKDQPSPPTSKVAPR